MFRDYNVGLDNLNDIRIIQYGIVQKIQKTAQADREIKDVGEWRVVVMYYK